MINLYTLPYCGYSQAALKMMKELNLQHRNIVVKENEKEKYKKKHKMNTFPQIFIVTKKKNIKIGGYDDLQEIVNRVKM